MAKVMRKVNAVFGGEGNGGVIDPRVHFVRDSFVGMALVLSYLAETGRPLSELVAELPSYVILKEKFPMQEGVVEGLQKGLKAGFPGAKLNLADGVRVDVPEGWVHVRPSGTEPVLRIIAEAADKATAKGLLDRAARAVGVA